MESQKQVWDNIAPEWDKFKKPGHKTLEFVKKQKGKIIDIGSGSGRYLIKKKGLKFYLADFSEEMIKFAKKKAKKLTIDAEFNITELTKLPYEDNFFDAGICSDVLHCIKGKIKRKKILKEFFRVLKLGAKAKLSVWNKDSKRFKNSPKEKYVGWRDKGKRYYYLYYPEEFYKEVEDAGFKIISKIEPIIEIPIIVKKPLSKI